MPELPEVETVVRGLRSALRNRCLGTPEIWRPDLIEGGLRPFVRSARGPVTDVVRRGKWILIRLENQFTILSHLRMTGRYSLVEAGAPRGPHDHLQWPFHSETGALRYTDVRRFGRFRLLATAKVEAYLAGRGFGPEPFQVNPPEFALRLGHGQRSIKAALLDQRVVAGIGNIYADEILFAAKVDPRTPVHRLSGRRRERVHACMQQVLCEAILECGTSFVSFVGLEGRRGSFATRLAVFRRTGLPCPACGRPVERTKISGRSTHYCRRCQR